MQRSSKSNNQQGKARILRRNQTDAEKLLWRHLRNRRLRGCKFRRQHLIGPFIVDFVCLERSLIVELDGGQHASSVESDRQRTAFLESRGFKVVRFWNNEVLQNIEGVLEVLSSEVDRRAPSPRPSPAAAGERASG